MAKASTRQRAAARRTRQRRQRQLAALFAVVGVAILAVVLLILLSQGSSIAAQEVGDYSDLPQGVEEDGAPYIGDPDAPTTLVEYGDFACSACSAFTSTSHELFNTYVADGTLKFVFKPLSFINPQTSPTAAAAGLCAADEGKFFEMHDALFGVLNTYGSNAFTEKNVTQLAEQVGLDSDTFASCLKDSETRQTVRGFLAEAQSLGINSTPTMMFNGQLLDPGALPYSTVEQLIQGALP